MRLKIKKGSMSVEQIILLMLGLLVLVFVLVLIFKPDIIDYIVNLPGFAPPNNSIVDDVIVDPDVQAVCEFPIGVVKPAGSRSAIYLQSGLTDLNWESDGIYLSRELIGVDMGYPDLRLGGLEDGRVKFDSEYLDLGNEIYKKYPSLANQVAKLQDSYIVVNNVICKDENIDYEMKKEWPGDEYITIYDPMFLCPGGKFQCLRLNPYMDFSTSPGDYSDVSFFAVNGGIGNMIQISAMTGNGKIAIEKVAAYDNDNFIWINLEYLKGHEESSAKKGIVVLSKETRYVGDLEYRGFVKTNLKINFKAKENE